MTRMMQGALVAVAIVMGIGASYGRWENVKAERRATQQTRAEFKEYQADRVRLTQMRARTENPIQRERLARERGYIPRGETIMTE